MATAPDINLTDLTDAELLREAHRFAHDPVIGEWLKSREKWWATFRPRPDDPANFDQQSSFVYNRDKVAFLIGGNAAGTTTAAAAKTALFLLQQQPPPRRNTPFWIISNTYEQTCDVCWTEKLIGNGFIPECEVDWPRIKWHEATVERPAIVPLKPWPVKRGGHENRNWQLQFKSFEQGRTAMQARSIGGFWFSEQFPLEIFLEVLRGCREYMFPGGQFAEFTPIDPELSVWVEQLMDRGPKGWRFYRANTAANRPNLAAGWFEDFFGTVSEDMVATRQTGELASFENAIYPSFVREVHVVDESKIEIPLGAWHYMGTDWGSSVEHPHVTIWGYRDGMGCWVIYDEYWSTAQNMITIDHANAILDICAEWGWPVIEDDELSRSGRRIKSEDNLLYGTNFADPSRPGEMNSFSAYGIPTLPANNSVHDGIQYIKNLMKIQQNLRAPKVVISSRCEHLIAELRKYRWRRSRKPGGNTSTLNPAVAKPEPLKKDDDTCDAFRYLVYSADLPSEAPSSGRSWPEKPGNRTVQLERTTRRNIDRSVRNGILPNR